MHFFFLAILRLLSYSPLCRRIIYRTAHYMAGTNVGDPRINGEYAILDCLIPPQGIVFDIGANEGQYTTRLLSKHADAVVHAFEPSAEAAQRLVSATLAYSGRVFVNRCALGSAAGRGILFTRGEGSSLAVQHEVPYAHWEEIEVVRLADYIAQHNIPEIAMLKIDVEGFEVEVLKGLDLAHNRPLLIQFEYNTTWLHSGVFLKDAFALLAADYDLYRILPFGLRYTTYTRSNEYNVENFIYCNYLAVRRDCAVLLKTFRVFDHSHPF